jgi:hypothetical protein
MLKVEKFEKAEGIFEANFIAPVLDELLALVTEQVLFTAMIRPSTTENLGMSSGWSGKH